MNVPLVMTPGQNNIPDTVPNIIIGIESVSQTGTYGYFILVEFLHVAFFMSIEMMFVCCVSGGDKNL